MCLCNDTYEYVRLVKEFDVAMLRTSLEDSSQSFDTQQISQWFLELGNTARLQLYLLCFGSIAQHFESKKYLAI